MKFTWNKIELWKMGYWVDMRSGRTSPVTTFTRPKPGIASTVLRTIVGFLYKVHHTTPIPRCRNRIKRTSWTNRDVTGTWRTRRAWLQQFKGSGTKIGKWFAFSDEVYFPRVDNHADQDVTFQHGIGRGSEHHVLEVKLITLYFPPSNYYHGEDRFSACFNKSWRHHLEDYKEGDKLIPYQIVAEYKGPELGVTTTLPWMQPWVMHSALSSVITLLRKMYWSLLPRIFWEPMTPVVVASGGHSPLQLIDKEGK